MILKDISKKGLQSLFLLVSINSTILPSPTSNQKPWYDWDCTIEDEHVVRSPLTSQPLKDWTFIVYIAADNELRGFAARNIKQMASVGSNSYINIAAQLDIRLTGNKKLTRRYYIEKDKILHVNANDPHSQCMDSGDPNTLVSCCKWAIESYPAKNYALVLWNHGTGILDPVIGRTIDTSGLFSFNPETNRLELDRSIGFLDFLEAKENEERGICWDDSSGNYITNQGLDAALQEIRTKYLDGKKFNLIGFDACLMAMLEVANNIKSHTNVMVGSQELELGTGWDYRKVILPFAQGTLSEEELGKHIVLSYENTYGRITNDYTQSAVKMSNIDALEQNVHTVATLLIEALKNQLNDSVKNSIKASRNKVLCTHFDEPSYLDLHHLYCNLLANLKHFSIGNGKEETIKTQLSELLQQGCQLIDSAVLANVVGKNVSKAHGISIYFPERKIHGSYRKTKFVASNEWLTFLTHYLVL